MQEMPGDMGSNFWVGREDSPGGGMKSTLVLLPGKFHGQRNPQAMVRKDHKGWIQLKLLSTHPHIFGVELK